ncbi:MAG: isoleucine--tRNA ligase [Candidatus Micrarchaeota archaeon]|nr:isoleucine--tRNA ligase [Candidatus Micrarchaeota archaeon]
MFDLQKNEEYVLSYWKDKRILERTRERNRNGKPFYFLDGPPFVSGTLHPGQMWVKSMKDVLLRYKRFRGYSVYDRAGYDVHGLPIEKRAEAQLGVTNKKEIETRIGVERFVKACNDYVESYIGILNADYERFGISLDFSNPYVPSRKPYMEIEWGFLKSIYGKKLLYKSLSSTTYCKSCGTALSQGSMEVEHREDDDPSIFVAFRINKELSETMAGIDDNTYLLIWTTTPWTLPANVSVAANPNAQYVKARFKDKIFIVAKSRLDVVSKALGSSAEVLEGFSGEKLEGLYYINPLEQHVPMQKRFRKYHRIVFAEHMVSIDEGSGLVHIAPGHGLDDYDLGKALGLPIFSPVDGSGKYTGDAGAYAGLEVPEEANRRVLEDLKSSGSLIHHGSVRHSYPHCWRCDTKLIFIATEQWKIRIQKVKKKLVSENRKVSWHPSEAQKWMEDLLLSAPDWTVSRQRYWGVPMPIWECECGERLVIGSLAELKEHAADSGAVDALENLHRPYIDRIMLKCGRCGKEMKRISDVLDVWFDSSMAFRASLKDDEEFKRLFPMDFILEAVEQIRAWFSYQLKTSVIVYGKRPYRNVVTHGMMLGEDGRELHKKLGNYVPLDELLKTTSADAFRLWCTSHTPQLDLLFSKERINEAEKVVRLMYNISNLLQEYSDSIGYIPKRVKKPRALEKLDPEDAWIVSRMNRLIRDMTTHLDDYDIYKAANPIRSFIIGDLSRFYLKSAKKRISYGSRKKAKQTVDMVNYLFYNTLVLISIFTPFSSERIYLERYGKGDGSVFFNSWPKCSKKQISDEVENSFDVALEAITAILNSREKMSLRLRWPIEKATVEVNNDSVHESLKRLSYIIEEYTNVRKLELKRASAAHVEIKPLFSKIGPEFKQNAGAVAEALKNANAKELLDGISKSGSYELNTGRGTFKVTKDHFDAVEQLQGENAIQFKYGIAYADKKISEELKNEGLVREFERRVQIARKGMGLKKSDRIELYYEAHDELSNALKSNEGKVRKKLNAVKVSPGIKKGMKATEFEIEENIIRIAIAKV